MTDWETLSKAAGVRNLGTILAVNPNYEKFLRLLWVCGYKINKIMELQSQASQLASISQTRTLAAFKVSLHNQFRIRQ